MIGKTIKMTKAGMLHLKSAQHGQFGKKLKGTALASMGLLGTASIISGVSGANRRAENLKMKNKSRIRGF
jgi:hypothetical protein